MNSSLNRWNAPTFEAVACDGVGVFPTLKSLAGLVLDSLNRQHSGTTGLVKPKPVAAQNERVPVAVGAGGTPAAVQSRGGGAGAPPRNQIVQLRTPAGQTGASSSQPQISVRAGPDRHSEPRVRKRHRGGRNRLVVTVCLLGILGAAATWFLWDWLSL